MGAFKLGKMTFGSLFKKPETVLYPIQEKPKPAGLKGHIEIDVDNCILCGMCDRSCSTDCITVDKAKRTWTIDRYQCIQCGYCITVCPKKCLSMNPNYAPAAVTRDADTIEVPDQGKPAKETATAQKADVEAPAKSAAASAPAQPDAAESSAVSEKPADPVLEAKLAIMEPEKAEKVKAVLAARG